MNRSVGENSKSRAPRSIENRQTSQSMYHSKKSSIGGSELPKPQKAQKPIEPAKNPQAIIKSIKVSRSRQIGEEMLQFKKMEEMILKKEAISKMNDNIRKLNSQKSKKKRTLKKNTSLNLAQSLNFKKPKLSQSTKGSFIHEFKRIKKEIRREDLKFKSRTGTACTSPKNLKAEILSKEDRFEGDQFEGEFKKKNIRKFIKKKKKRMK